MEINKSCPTLTLIRGGLSSPTSTSTSVSTTGDLQGNLADYLDFIVLLLIIIIVVAMRK